ncbi:MAG TPA: three-Cys-motif partner protein TcmP, partial [Candidatus Paceibacterota bacterium]|nr:three-Cys-motif partner protein TcmP [Candidatus Paceibacterota bacterium]
MSTKHTGIWSAEPHTIAKIAMLRKYLFQWFSILGTSGFFAGKDLWYIDGFAGPGEYTNHPVGSPNAALDAAAEAIDAAGARWVAGDVRCFFIEEEKWTYEHLLKKLAGHRSHARVHHTPHNGSFVDGLAQLRSRNPNPFLRDSPVFAFIDPFGATDVPFSSVRELLMRPSSEVLVNLDSDGASRINSAGASASHLRHLDALFGDRSWEAELAGARDQADAARKILRLYKAKLLGIPNIKYAFAFEMRKKAHVLDYHLVFATGHPRGLEKMKEVMRSFDKTGSYCFSDAHVGQAHLFSFTDPKDASDVMAKRFAGTVQTYEE